MGQRIARLRRSVSGRVEDASDRPRSDITELLQQWTAGDHSALDSLIEPIYGQLREVAENALARDWGCKSLQPTDLVHEAYFKLIGVQNVDWKSRTHFLAFVGRLMRHILIDRARRRAAQKRGGSAAQIPIESGALGVGNQGGEFVDLIGLDSALTELARRDEELSRLVELRFFSGLTVDETAEVLGVSARTVKREWRFVKAWLKTRLSASAA